MKSSNTDLLRQIEKLILSTQELLSRADGAETAREAERFQMGQRIRSVTQGPDGALWVLEDGSGRLLRLTSRE